MAILYFSGLIIFAVAVYVMRAYTSFDHNINLQVAARMGWTYHHRHKNLFKNSRIFGKRFINRKYDLFEGVFENTKFSLSIFFNPAGNDSQGKTPMATVIFETPKNFMPIEVFDRGFVGKLPQPDQEVTLESGDFNKEYAIFAPDPKNAFYDLPPDAMSRLLDVKNSSHLEYAFELLPNKIFTYTYRTEYPKYGMGTMVKGDVSKEIVDRQKNAVLDQLQSAYSIYKAIVG